MRLPKRDVQKGRILNCTQHLSSSSQFDLKDGRHDEKQMEPSGSPPAV